MHFTRLVSTALTTLVARGGLRAPPRAHLRAPWCSAASSVAEEQKALRGAMRGVVSASLRPERQELEMTAADGSCFAFPWLWLRDNCQCPECFNAHMQSRTIDWRHTDITVPPAQVESEAGGVAVSWADGHQSRFDLQWLRARAFRPENARRHREDVLRPPRVPWDAANFPRVLKTLRYEHVMSSDSALLEWLEALATHGVALLEGAPTHGSRVRTLAERVAFIKRTHYGEEFEVKNKPDTTNVAYLSTPLQMHTDLPYYEYKPGVNLLHCLVQARAGAANLLADGVRVAEALRETRPELYAALVHTPVDWCDDGADGGRSFLTLHRSPAICEDADGDVVRINYSQQQRASHFCVSAEAALLWYKAHHAFTQLLYKPEFLVRIKTRPGDILSFDNVRLLHGREGYDDAVGSVAEGGVSEGRGEGSGEGGGERTLIGAYLDWDGVLSRIRVLRARLAPTKIPS